MRGRQKQDQTQIGHAKQEQENAGKLGGKTSDNLASGK